MLQAKFFAGIVLSSVAAVSFAAISPVGTWSGHLHLTASAGATPQQKQQISKIMEITKKTKISLILKADHTFVSDVSGGPQKGQKKGKWTLSGNSVTLVTPQGSQPFKLASNGKSMSFALPSRPGVSGEVTFTR